jgi:lipase
VWGPLAVEPDATHEFVVEAPGLPTTHIYRSPFPRSSRFVNIRPQLLTKDDLEAGAAVYMQRPRGYFGAGRDVIELNGEVAPGIPGGVPSVSTSKVLLPYEKPVSVVARFNVERIAMRTWPMKDRHVSVAELTY